MGRHVGRMVAATAVVAATGTGAVLFGAGTAGAAPLIAGDCETTVTGKPGQPVMVDTTSLLGKNGSRVALGKAPKSGTSTLSVPTQSLMKDGGLLGLGKTLNGLVSAIGPTCDVTVRTVSAVSKPVGEAAAPVRKAAEPVGRTLGPVVNDVNREANKVINGGGGTQPQRPPQGTGPGGPGPNTPPGQNGPNNPGTPPGTNNPGGSSSGLPGFSGDLGSSLPFDQIPAFGALSGGFSPVLSPSALYGNLPFVTSGMFQPQGNSFGSQVPGFSPQFGMLGQGGQVPQDGSVMNAGDAQALDGGVPGQDVGLPILVAVLALSGVTATLVRTWVLRRAA